MQNFSEGWRKINRKVGEGSIGNEAMFFKSKVARTLLFCYTL